MEKLIGIFKFIISFVLFLFFVMTIFNLKLSNIWEWLAGALIISTAVALYIFYLITTGINNVTASRYKLNIISVIGLVMHFVYMVAITLYSYLSFGINIAITSSLVSAVGITLGIFDLRRFLLSWRARKSANL